LNASLSPQITPKAQCAKVNYFQDAHERHTHKQAQKSTTVGQKIRLAKQLGPFVSDQLILLKEHRESRVL
jgi:hypothetical protein